MVVNDDRNTSIGIESEEPFFLLNIGIDITGIVRRITK